MPAQTHVAMAHAVEACGAQAGLRRLPSRAPATSTSTSSRASSPQRTRAISVVHYLGLPVDMEPRARDRPPPRPASWSRTARSRSAPPSTARTSACTATSAASRSIRSSTSPPARAGWSSRAARTSPSASRSSARSASTRACSPTAATPAPTRSSTLGLNYRLGEIGAAMGVEQMKRLPGFLEQRERNFELLSEGLVGARRADACSTAGHEGERALEPLLPGRRCWTSRCASAASEIIEPLKAEGVGTSVYYPKPLSRHALLPRDLRLRAGLLPGGDAHQLRLDRVPGGPARRGR